MIIRTTRGRVRAGAESEVFARLRAATEARGRPPGLQAVLIGRHLSADGMELYAITVWTDVESLVTVFGEGWEAPKWLDGLDAYITNSTVEHWETAVADFEPFVGPGPTPAIVNEGRSSSASSGSGL